MRSLRKYAELAKMNSFIGRKCSCQEGSCPECVARKDIEFLQSHCSKLTKACLAYLYRRYYFLEEFQLMRTVLLGGDVTNHTAIGPDRDCENAALAMAIDMYGALDEADTAFVVLNLCDDLTPQARGAMGKAWVKLQEVIGNIQGPESEMAQAAAENRQRLCDTSEALQ